MADFEKGILEKKEINLFKLEEYKGAVFCYRVYTDV